MSTSPFVSSSMAALPPDAVFLACLICGAAVPTVSASVHSDWHAADVEAANGSEQMEG